MSIGGGCLALYLLGKNRIKGPVDNVLIKTDKAIKLLLDNKYFNYIKTGKRVKKLKDASYKDSKQVPYLYNYEDNLIIIHNDVDEKYLKALEERIKSFNAFYDNVKHKDNYYFIFSVPYAMIGHNTHEQIKNRLEDVLKLLQKYNILSKTIFVWAKAKPGLEKAWYNIWPTNKVIIDLNKKYKFNYAELTEVELETATGVNNAQKQFKAKIKKFVNKDNFYLYF